MFDLNSFIQALQQESTRDLAWALFAPGILQSSPLAQFYLEPNAQRLQWLQELDKQPQLFNTSQRLGRYYESLWAAFFAHDQQYRLIARNIPVQVAGKTLGELDFILHDTINQCYLHLEIAVKFYLFHAEPDIFSITSNSNWQGPNSKDNLEAKWQKLTQAQTNLSNHEASRAVLKTMGIDQPVTQAVSLKGYLFRPPYSQQTPLEFNPQNCIYPYYNTSSFFQLDIHNKMTGIIPRQRWLTPTHNHQSILLADKVDIINAMKTRATPIMAGFFESYGKHYQEQQRFFIVPDNWPNGPEICSPNN